MSAAPGGFASRIVRWQRSHGRSGLPWQDTRDPYRVWLSEIMLQQTQVATVLAYYERFLSRFPDVRSLAAAPLDDVMGLWSGLGYYSRARNMHRCAREVVTLHGGQFPRTAQQLETLPGIGRSTAAAIASFCFGERIAILDGNVKRVLTRVLGFDGDLAAAREQQALWDRAGELLPRRSLHESMPAYTQGLMDLGATVCVARNPSCLACPVNGLCAAYSAGNPHDYPVKTRKPRRSAQSLWLLLARSRSGAVWLERRPPRGIWAGLYCAPVFETRAALGAAVPIAARRQLSDGTPFVHVLTHKDLHLHPVVGEFPEHAGIGADGAWFARDQWEALGLPAPVRKLLTAAH